MFYIKFIAVIVVAGSLAMHSFDSIIKITSNTKNLVRSALYGGAMVFAQSSITSTGNINAKIFNPSQASTEQNSDKNIYYYHHSNGRGQNKEADDSVGEIFDNNENKIINNTTLITLPTSDGHLYNYSDNHKFEETPTEATNKLDRSIISNSIIISKPSSENLNINQVGNRISGPLPNGINGVLIINPSGGVISIIHRDNKIENPEQRGEK